MKTTELGLGAEAAVARLLEEQGYKIISRNWKTKVCELDIVAEKQRVIYFVEVKYRSTGSQGSGFEYIGPQKQRRLDFAAQIYCQQNHWDGDYRILAAEVTGADSDNIALTEVV